MDIQIIQASSSLRLRSVLMPEPVLCQVEQGEKHLRAGLRTYCATSEHLMVLPAGLPMSVHNRITQGRYRAVLVSLSQDVLQQFQRLYPMAPLPGSARAEPVLVRCSATLQESWRHLVDLLQHQADQKVCELAAFTVLMCLRLQGQDGALLRVRDDPAARVERVLRDDPALSWTMPQVARRLHVSESHLRRQLARAETSFRKILETVRLGQALSELMSGSLPIAIIAHRCGYASGSRFARRFQRHFGVLPSDVRTGRLDADVLKQT